MSHLPAHLRTGPMAHRRRASESGGGSELLPAHDSLRVPAANGNRPKLVVGVQGVVSLLLLLGQRLCFGRYEVANVHAPPHLVSRVGLAGMEGEIAEEQNITHAHRYGDGGTTSLHILFGADIFVRPRFPSSNPHVWLPGMSCRQPLRSSTSTSGIHTVMTCVWRVCSP